MASYGKTGGRVSKTGVATSMAGAAVKAASGHHSSLKGGAKAGTTAHMHSTPDIGASMKFGKKA